jgi:hypothetical protein
VWDKLTEDIYMKVLWKKHSERAAWDVARTALESVKQNGANSIYYCYCMGDLLGELLATDGLRHPFRPAYPK